MKVKGKEAQIRNQIEGQEQKIAKAQKRIEELNQELTDYLAAVQLEPEPVQAIVDNHNYCGKILYASKKAANSARRLINRDLVKAGKKPMKRSYFCDQCEAWHLTTVPHWMPHPEKELTV